MGLLQLIHPRHQAYAAHNPTYDKLLEEQKRKGGLTITADGRVYEGRLWDNQEMSIHDGRTDWLARVQPQHLRNYIAAQEELKLAKEAQKYPYSSPPGHWAYTEKGTQERKRVKLEMANYFKKAASEFAEWFTPSKAGLVRGALVGAIPRDEVSTLRDILTVGRWFGKETEEFFLHNITQTVSSNRHVVRLIDRIPNQHVSVGLRPYEMPRDSEIKPRRIQLEALRDAVRMHVGYSEQVDTDVDVDSAQRTDALMDFERAIEVKTAAALEEIDIETDDITGVTEISGVSNGGYHSSTKLGHEFRKNKTEFERLHHARITDVTGHPSTIDAIFQNTWMHLTGEKLHPAGLMTSGGRIPFGLFNGMHLNSSYYCKEGVLYWTVQDFAIIHLRCGGTTHKWYNPEREVSQTIMNDYNTIECTADHLDWSGDDGRGYGYKTKITE